MNVFSPYNETSMVSPYNNDVSRKIVPHNNTCEEKLYIPKSLSAQLSGRGHMHAATAAAGGAATPVPSLALRQIESDVVDRYGAWRDTGVATARPADRGSGGGAERAGTTTTLPPAPLSERGRRKRSDPSGPHPNAVVHGGDGKKSAARPGNAWRGQRQHQHQPLRPSGVDIVQDALRECVFWVRAHRVEAQW